MKKILVTTLTLSLFLAGCSDLKGAIRGKEYVESSKAKQEADKQAEQAKNEAAELEKALQADASAFPQLSTEVGKDEAQVIIKTSQGDISLKLFPKHAPLAVENFLTHAKDGYYNGVTFHRVIKDFMIQGGDPVGDGTGGESIWAGKDKKIDSGNGFANEISPYLYNIRGALSMANAGPDTNGSQFFINQNADSQSEILNTTLYPEPIIKAYEKGGNPPLDGGYTVFGQVIDGIEVVDKIATVQVNEIDAPMEDITITSIEIVKDYDFK